MSAAVTFVQGQEVYDIYGQVGRYVAAASHGHLVEPIYDAEDDDEPHYAQVQTWSEVFAKPPTERLTADIQELVTELNAKRLELNSVETDIAAAKSVRQGLLQHAKQNPQLGDLYLWLEGKATHIVVLGPYSVEVGTVEEILRKNDRDRELRLLSLFVDAKANRYWVGRSNYSDGSGSCTPCLLASSEEHAHEQARACIADQLRNHQYRNDSSWIRLAIKFGVPISAEQQASLLATQRERAENALNNANLELQRAQEKLNEAQAEAAKFTEVQP